MRGFVGNPSPTLILLNEFHYQHDSYYPFSWTEKRLRPCINVNPVSKSCIRCTITYKGNAVSMLLMSTPRLNLMVQSTRGMEFRTCVGTLLNCGEDEAIDLVIDEEGVGESSREWKLPPWGDMAHQDEPTFQSEDANQSKILEGEPLENDSKVHFLEETDKVMLSKRLLILSRKNKVRSALELFRSLQLAALLPSLHALNSLLACLLRKGLFDDGLRIFEFMKSNELLTGHTYSLVLKAVANAHGFLSALEMFKAWEHKYDLTQFDAVVYNTMISICGKDNNWVEAERTWRLMEENGCSATHITYTLLVSTFVRCNQNELAIDTYVKMVQNSFKPGNDTMQAIIGASSKEGKWDFALRVFHDMLKCGLQPNSVAFNALINALGNAKEVTLAFSIYNVMKSMGHSPDVYTWNALLGALYKANRYNDAIHLFEFVKREKAQLNIHIYNTILMSCSKLGLWDRALQILWEMEASGLAISASSYNIVITACEMARKPEIALQVYERMIHQKHTPDTFTHLSLIRCCIWGSLWDEVELLLNKSAPDVSVYNAVIQGMCLRGKTDLAKKLYTKMRENGIQPDGKTRALMLQNLPKDPARLKNRWASGFKKRHRHYHHR
ncbi:pentatricopeptide repeat-containing protein At3g29290 [Benincasa hispida]|uniref:pentatricopeptide repeat-containing protein At3g29290 n=1 Tax=Benincasa hispida TaxID=102211 RepID=UPI0019016F8F|nr:pentatricopeptide repeat-containing protein At3g29290 [Benincasa hispida]XP_038891012.1 pentatricopeptide repeat-containing protein At3g29290 [Benincasa hispida]